MQAEFLQPARAWERIHRSPRQNDIGTKQRSRELEMTMSPPKRMMGTIVAKKQDRL